MSAPSNRASAAASSGRNAPRAPPASGVKNAYLVLYNALSAAAWANVLRHVVLSGLLNARDGPAGVYPAVGEWTKWTQTMAGLEVLHSLFGVVRAPVFTTLMQVSSRFLLVWAIVDAFPVVAHTHPLPYTTMLLAWSVTEVVRYSFFALQRGLDVTPAPLLWMRYNGFFVLYPIGILSECALVYFAVPWASKLWGDVYAWALYAILAIYVPGSYILYTHMVGQRKKVMRAAKADKTK